MGKLHDNLKEIGYEGHSLEVYLVRILFCLFADDTTIFNKQLFQDYVEQRTNEDGSDLAAKIHELFQVLNTPVDKRFKNLDEQLAEFPYINGKLFEESLPIASFDSNMRQALLNSCSINWAKISPAIFGSMFQSVLNPKQRRNLGAHYTSEKNILKLIKPLFLDDLWKEFESIKGNLNKLPEFHKKLSMLKFLDPACGCGNFLVITYRELRLLELEILRTLYKSGQRFIDVSRIIWLDVDQFFGIEYEEFPSRIAEVAMWLIDHQMNILISNEFGQYFVRLPLSKAAQIHHDDALEVDWHSIVPNSELSYIIGNPPFSGSKIMKQSQRDQIGKLFENADGSGVLDYVTGWYLKAAKYIMGTRIKAAFVSTNSIVQGEQTSVLWGQLLNKYHIKIHFAHRTFKWSNEAKGNAAVYCIIVGFANYDATSKIIFEYVDIKGEPHELKAKNINPYLVDAKDLIIQRRSIPLGPINKLVNGSVPADGGNLILTKEDKDFIEKKDPSSRIWIRDYLGGEGFLNGEKRYCLWLKNCTPDQLKAMPEVMKRVNQVREMRIKSTKFATQKKGEIPSLFTEDRQPLEGFYIAIPRTSSENRKYIPIGYLVQVLLPVMIFKLFLKVHYMNLEY